MIWTSEKKASFSTESRAGFDRYEDVADKPALLALEPALLALTRLVSAINLHCIRTPFSLRWLLSLLLGVAKYYSPGRRPLTHSPTTHPAIAPSLAHQSLAPLHSNRFVFLSSLASFPLLQSLVFIDGTS